MYACKYVSTNICIYALRMQILQYIQASIIQSKNSEYVCIYGMYVCIYVCMYVQVPIFKAGFSSRCLHATS